MSSRKKHAGNGKKERSIMQEISRSYSARPGEFGETLFKSQGDMVKNMFGGGNERARSEVSGERSRSRVSSSKHSGNRRASSDVSSVEACNRGGYGSCDPYDACGLPRENVVPVPVRSIKLMLEQPYGFIANAPPFNIVTVANMPFLINQGNDGELLITPNPALGTTMQNIYDYLGIGQVLSAANTEVAINPECTLPSIVMLANLPAEYERFSGFHLLTNLAVAINGILTLVMYRIEWVHNHLAPAVGSWIHLRFGATDSVVEVSSIGDRCQILTVIPTGLRTIEQARIMHMSAERDICTNYTEVPVNGVDECA